jgi:hypothetical protein
LPDQRPAIFNHHHLALGFAVLAEVARQLPMQKTPSRCRLEK